MATEIVRTMERVRLSAGELSRRRAVEKAGYRLSYTTREAGKVVLIMTKRGGKK